MEAAFEYAVELDAKNADFYQIASFSNPREKGVKYMTSEEKIYGNICSFLIMASLENENARRLVNCRKTADALNLLLLRSAMTNGLKTRAVPSPL